MLQECREYQVSMHNLFIDFKAAYDAEDYDKVKSPSLEGVMQRAGLYS